MKFKTKSLMVALISLVMLSSCKDKAKENADGIKNELLAENQYQCPMDCEDGKTYVEAGSCPVCKMGLKLVSKDTAMTCSVHKNGNCSCDGDKCACENCEEHGKSMTCAVHKDGEYSCARHKCALRSLPRAFLKSS